ncbi:MAG: hypothetical protein AAGE52_33735 [Myxococcota bacterium]
MRTALLALSIGALVFGAASAHAQYEGEWQAGPLQIRHEVRSWGNDCGPRPPASLSQPGGTVQIRQSGDQLQLSGAVRGATNRCWSDKPGIRRISSTFQGGRWTTICRTRDGDAQPENGRYVFTASGADSLRYQEETTWNWRLRDSACQATRRASRTLTRASAAPPPEETAPPEEPQPRCDSVGPAARIRIRPGESTVEPGSRVCFRAQVVDAAGCARNDGAIELSLRSPPGTTATFDGRCFEAGATAAEAEGLFRIVATQGAMRATETVEVRTEDLTHLTAGRIRQPAQRGDDVANAEAENASGVSARTTESDSTLLWVGVGVSVGVLLLLIVILARRRSSPTVVEEQAEERPKKPPAPVGATAVPPRRVCPVCGYDDDAGNGFCPKDGARLVDPRDPKTRAQGMICPACRRGYEPTAETCTHDGEELIPYSMFIARQTQAPAVRKICPECGTTYDAEVTFCGKDGATLETIN